LNNLTVNSYSNLSNPLILKSDDSELSENYHTPYQMGRMKLLFSAALLGVRKKYLIDIPSSQPYNCGRWVRLLMG